MRRITIVQNILAEQRVVNHELVCVGQGGYLLEGRVWDVHGLPLGESVVFDKP